MWACLRRLCFTFLQNEILHHIRLLLNPAEYTCVPPGDPRVQPCHGLQNFSASQGTPPTVCGSGGLASMRMTRGGPGWLWLCASVPCTEKGPGAQAPRAAHMNLASQCTCGRCQCTPGSHCPPASCPSPTCSLCGSSTPRGGIKQQIPVSGK